MFYNIPEFVMFDDFINTTNELLCQYTVISYFFNGISHGFIGKIQIHAIYLFYIRKVSSVKRTAGFV